MPLFMGAHTKPELITTFVILISHWDFRVCETISHKQKPGSVERASQYTHIMHKNKIVASHNFADLKVELMC